MARRGAWQTDPETGARTWVPESRPPRPPPPARPEAEPPVCESCGLQQVTGSEHVDGCSLAPGPECSRCLVRGGHSPLCTAPAAVLDRAGPPPMAPAPIPLPPPPRPTVAYPRLRIDAADEHGAKVIAHFLADHRAVAEGASVLVPVSLDSADRITTDLAHRGLGSRLEITADEIRNMSFADRLAVQVNRQINAPASPKIIRSRPRTTW